jgi:hypothetical protein
MFTRWNPFITAIEGVPEAGARLVVTIRAPGRKARDFRPRVLAAREGRELRWLGRLIMPGIFDGEHIHELEEVAPGRTRYIQREKLAPACRERTPCRVDKVDAGRRPAG